jgi:molybdopterin converting factor subunit 1
MKLEIRLFATLRDLAGASRVTVSIDEPATVQKLLQTVEENYPSLVESLPTVLVALNKAYAGPDAPINEGDEVAFFPPVSGGVGAQNHPTYFAVEAGDTDLAYVHRQLTRPDVGAIVTFTGSVRGQTNRTGHPKSTKYLEYEAYEEMALAKMEQIAREIWERWPLVKGVAIIQRIGKLDVGDSTTIVACAAGHRDQGAFEAARYGIDRLKEIVPVWKKEVDEDQSAWIEGDYRPTEADN